MGGGWRGEENYHPRKNLNITHTSQSSGTGTQMRSMMKKKYEGKSEEEECDEDDNDDDDDGGGDGGDDDEGGDKQQQQRQQQQDDCNEWHFVPRQSWTF